MSMCNNKNEYLQKNTRETHLEKLTTNQALQPKLVKYFGVWEEKKKSLYESIFWLHLFHWLNTPAEFIKFLNIRRSEYLLHFVKACLRKTKLN